MVGQATVTLEAVARLRPDEGLVFDWVHIAFCCSGAREVSIHAVPARRIPGSSKNLLLPSDPADLVDAHRAAVPHVGARTTELGVDGRRIPEMRGVR
jgi:hypothetical protein